MNTFDLDVKNYSVNELINMFSLSKPYEVEDVMNHKMKLKDNIYFTNK